MMFARFVATPWWLGASRGMLGAARFPGAVLRQMVPAAGVMAAALGQQVMALASSSSAKKPPTDKGERWTPEEDQLLKEGVEKFGPLWNKVAETLPQRGSIGCMRRWTFVVNPDLKKGPWADEEDTRLTDLVAEFGEGKWVKIAEHMGGRMRNDCRQRWAFIDPSLKKGNWSVEEDAVLLAEYALHPNKWNTIAKKLPKRSDTSIYLRHQHLTCVSSDGLAWTDGDDDQLKAAVSEHGGTKTWGKIAEHVPGRSGRQCMKRWNTIVFGWSEVEDALLIKRVQVLGCDGDGKWAAIAAGISGKSALECKSRWESDAGATAAINTAPSADAISTAAGSGGTKSWWAEDPRTL